MNKNFGGYGKDDFRFKLPSPVYYLDDLYRVFTSISQPQDTNMLQDGLVRDLF